MSNTFFLHPALILILGAVLLPFIKGALRKPFILAVPVIAFMDVLLINSTPGVHGIVQFMDKWELIFGRADSLSIIFASIMGLMAIIATLYALDQSPAHHAAAWFYVAGSLGTIYAGDYLTLFLFWEMMAFASTFLIWLNKEKGALQAGYRYLLVHTFGGVLLLLGFTLYYQDAGSLAFNAMDKNNTSLATWLVMAGLMLNAAVVPFHSWLPDAYSKSTLAGGVFMCAFTTKTAVYTLARGFAGFDILIVLGLVMAVYGIIYALKENDVRKLLGWEIVSQVGYMVVGVGIGTALAINGTAAHAVAHILYKGLLFMGAGAVIGAMGMGDARKLTCLGGMAKKMPITTIFFMMGALSVAGFPLLSGFVSKSMIIAASFAEHHLVVAFGLMVVSVGTFLAAGLRLPYLMFFTDYRGKNADAYNEAKDPALHTRLAMGIAVALCLIIGVFPGGLYALLPNPGVEFHPYSAYHLSETLQILMAGFIAFYFLKQKLAPKDVELLDLDYIYRKAGCAFLWCAQKPIQSFDNMVGKIYKVAGLDLLMRTSHFWSWFDWNIIDRILDGSAKSFRSMGRRVATILQRGNIQQSLCITVVIIAIFVVASVSYL